MASYIDDAGYATRIEVRAAEASNLATRLREVLNDLDEMVEQAFAARGSSEATMDSFYGKSSGWTADVRSLANRNADFANFLDNGTVAAADRQADFNRFK